MSALRMYLLHLSQGMTQKEIAERLEMYQPTYSLLESGRLKPYRRQAKLLEEYFGEPIERLLRPWKPKKKSWAKGGKT
jgi:transcriptional regulator with XRE-family HTH domain